MKKGIIIIAFIFISVANLLADVPKTINYQGRLRTAANQAVADGQYMITFRLYDADTAGTKVWEESQLVNVKQGYFNTTLGNINAMSTSMFDKPLWLGLKVGNEAEMTPRMALSATPHAFNIADGIVTTSKITDNAVTTAKISDGNVTTGKIADSAVTTVKIADGAITSDKLASALSSGQIADGAVTTAKIADNAVTSVKIADKTISTCDIADNTITAAKIANSTITGAKIASTTIDGTNIKNTTITNANIADNAINTQAKAPWAPLVYMNGSQITNPKIACGYSSSSGPITFPAGLFSQAPIVAFATVGGGSGHARVNNINISSLTKDGFTTYGMQYDSSSFGDYSNIAFYWMAIGQ